MRATIGMVMLMIGLFGMGEARAEWTKVSGGIPEAGLSWIAVHEKDPKLMYAAAKRQIYRSLDGGASWEKVLTLKGESNVVHSIWINGEDPSDVWIATDRGLRRSVDGGEHWKKLPLGSLKSDQNVTWIEPDRNEAGSIWVGTQKGLYHAKKDGTSEKNLSLRDIAVQSVYTQESMILVASDKGFFRSDDRGAHWTRVLAEGVPEKASAPDALAQFAIEELSVPAGFSNAVFLAGEKQLFVGSRNGLFHSDTAGKSWEKAPALSLPDRSVSHLSASEKMIYLGTDKGVFETNGQGTLRDISTGLPFKKTHMLAYHSGSGDLFAATEGGIFRYPKPGFVGISEPTVALQQPSASDWLSRFDHEPTVLEVQQAAIRYAEVHPDKIARWRRAAAAKAWMPTVSVSADQSEDQNIDLDRGGTNDPDRFIEGPLEESGDWHVGVSWDLGELVWNDDQTSIDTRSKLMAELRDDVLNEVTHLYFERRRLQVEMLMRPAVELPLGIEKELKLQELTAGVDALTGGYFSARLKEVGHVGHHG